MQTVPQQPAIIGSLTSWFQGVFTHLLYSEQLASLSVLSPHGGNTYHLSVGMLV